jgi:hypothetical protein
MNDVRVTTWSELNDRLYDGCWNASIQRFRSSFAYRGLSDAGYELKTTLMRLQGPFPLLERHLLRNFRKYAHRDVVPADSVWNWLATAQHFGLPTRLLDWTFSPYVAMHFATASLNRYDVDGVIWCVDYVKAHRFLPARLRHLLEEEGSNLVTAEILDRFVNSLGELDATASDGDFVIFFEPPSLDQRIVNQYALFSLMSSPTATLDQWLALRPELLHRIIIPAALKWEVRDKLDQANITERVMFPGLDGVSSWLKRLYSPKELP